MPAVQQTEDKPRPEAKKEEGPQEVHSAAIFRDPPDFHGFPWKEEEAKQTESNSEARASQEHLRQSVCRRFRAVAANSCSGKTDREVRRA